VHCLKYGLTTNNILGLEVVLMGGEIIRLGGKHLDSEHYDLLGLMTGSEGFSESSLKSPCAYCRSDRRAWPSARIFQRRGGSALRRRDHRARHHSRGMEMMDKATIHAVERFQPAAIRSTPRPSSSWSSTERPPKSIIWSASSRKSPAAEARQPPRRQTAKRAPAILGRRKNAFPAVSCIGPDYLCMDGTIPRGRLPEVLKGMDELAKKHGLRVANVFHAGDGNLHPLILYDASIDAN